MPSAPMPARLAVLAALAALASAAPTGREPASLHPQATASNLAAARTPGPIGAEVRTRYFNFTYRVDNSAPSLPNLGPPSTRA